MHTDGLMRTQQIARIVLLSVCLVACSLLLRRATTYELIPIRTPLAVFPMQLARWQGAHAEDFSQDVLDVLGVDDYLNRVYRTDAAPVLGLYVGYYQSQRQGDTMHSPMNCLPGSGWSPVKSGRTTIALDATAADARRPAGPPAIEVNRYVVQKSGDSMLVLYWYQSHGRVVASEYWGKLYMVLDAIRMNRTDAALVRVVVPMAGPDAASEEAAEQAGAAFVRSMMPHLANHLPA